MSAPMKITVLVENTVDVGGLMAEHGLAFLIETEERKILFDTGQTDLLMLNALKLGLSLSGIESIVLSHGHYDHTGGLAKILDHVSTPIIYLHPDALNSKYVKNQDGTSSFIGIKRDLVDKIRHHPKVFWTTQPMQLSGQIFVTGPIPRETVFEDVGGPFFLDDQFTRPDPLFDDQALFFEDPHGINVILGCAHAGVINTLQYVKKITQAKCIYSVMGGMHLKNAPSERLQQTITAMRQMGIQQFRPMHCTGYEAATAFRIAFPGQCFALPTGSRVAI